MLHKNERIALFIDGLNLYATTRCLEFESDYVKLLGYFSNWCHLILICASCYTPLYQDQEYSPRHALTNWLDYNVLSMPSKQRRISITSFSSQAMATTRA